MPPNTSKEDMYVYKVSWNVPISRTTSIVDFHIKEQFKVFGSKEKCDEFYGELIKAASFVGLTIEPRYERMKIEP